MNWKISLLNTERFFPSLVLVALFEATPEFCSGSVGFKFMCKEVSVSPDFFEVSGETRFGEIEFEAGVTGLFKGETCDFLGIFDYLGFP